MGSRVCSWKKVLELPADFKCGINFKNVICFTGSSREAGGLGALGGSGHLPLHRSTSPSGPAAEALPVAGA